MSMTAQKQDISDQAVVAAFAAKVKTVRRLAALYLLTVADIRGTSPRVWNAWKAKLLEDLFHSTQARITGGPGERRLHDRIDARRAEAIRLLRLYAVPDGAENALWQRLDAVYFQRHSADEIAWHARHLYFRVDHADPIVKARFARDGVGLQVMVYLPDQKELFSRICGFFGHARLSILEAKVHTTRHGYALDTFVVHDPMNPNAGYREVISYVEFELKRMLTERTPLEVPAIGRASRHLKHFPLSPTVSLFPDDKGTHYILEIVAGDRPGLLARIAYLLANSNVNVATAKITTLGERVEDVFLLEAPGCMTNPPCSSWNRALRAVAVDLSRGLHLRDLLIHRVNDSLPCPACVDSPRVRPLAAASRAACSARRVDRRARRLGSRVPTRARGPRCGSRRYSSTTSVSGNSTSVYPSRRRSRMRIGYRMPSR